MLNIKQESYANTNFVAIGLTRRGIEHEINVSVADALSTRPLVIGFRVGGSAPLSPGGCASGCFHTILLSCMHLLVCVL